MGFSKVYWKILGNILYFYFKNQTKIFNKFFSDNNCITLKFNNAPMKSVDFSCDGRIIATGSDDKSVKVI